MDRRSATREGLLPLTLSLLREFDLEEPPAPGRAATDVLSPLAAARGSGAALGVGVRRPLAISGTTRCPGMLPEAVSSGKHRSRSGLRLDRGDWI